MEMLKLKGRKCGPSTPSLSPIYVTCTIATDHHLRARQHLRNGHHVKWRRRAARNQLFPHF